MPSDVQTFVTRFRDAARMFDDADRQRLSDGEFHEAAYRAIYTASSRRIDGSP